LKAAAAGGRLAGYGGWPRGRFVAESLALSLLLFGAGLAVHEAAHLAVIRALGHDGVLLVRPWQIGLGGWSIYGVHAQPASPLGPAEQLVVNFAGPFLAAVPMALLLTRVEGRALRAALVLNVAVLLFYALIESLYVVLESGLGVEGDWLTSVWLNYGLPLVAAVGVTLALPPPCAEGKGGGPGGAAADRGRS
jgi:hypothetical protein